MTGQLPNAEKNRRANALIALQAQIEETLYRTQGHLLSESKETVSFLAETCRDGIVTGHTGSFMEVRIAADAPIERELMPIRIVGAGSSYLIGERIENE